MGIFSRKKVCTDKTLSEDEVFSMIREDREYARTLGDNPNELHCAGCPNSCAVSDVKCTRGRKLQDGFYKLFG